MTYHVFSDGACKGNPGPGGWGSLIRTPEGQEIELHGGMLQTTNNQMELQGAIEALKATPLGSNVILTTDSKYVIDGITSWIHGWKKRNWQASTGGPVKNQDHWKALDMEVSQRKVSWEWVKGHSGHLENERCDALANQGIADLPGGAAFLNGPSSSTFPARPAAKKVSPATKVKMNTTQVDTAAPTSEAAGTSSSMLRRKAPPASGSKVAPQGGSGATTNANNADATNAPPWDTNKGAGNRKATNDNNEGASSGEDSFTFDLN